MIVYSSWFIQRHPEIIPDDNILAPVIFHSGKHYAPIIARDEDLQLLNKRLKSNS